MTMYDVALADSYSREASKFSISFRSFVFLPEKDCFVTVFRGNKIIFSGIVTKVWEYGFELDDFSQLLEKRYLLGDARTRKL